RLLPQRLHTTIVGLVLAGWALRSVYSINPNADAAIFFPIFIVSLLSTVLALTIIAVANLRIAEWFFGLLGRAFSGLRAMLRPPLAYMARRGMRTGLTTGVFAIVLAMLQMFAVFAFIFRPDYNQAAQGYDVRLLATGSPTIALPGDLRRDVKRFTLIPTEGYVGPLHSPNSFGAGDRAFVPLFELTPELAAHPPLNIENKLKGLSKSQAWLAAAAGTKGLDCPLDPVTGKAVPNGSPPVRASAFVVMDFAAPGQCLQLQGADGPVTLRVAG